MDRGQTFCSMDGLQISFSHMVKARIFVLPKPGPDCFLNPVPPPPPGSLMVTPLFIEEENSKLPNNIQIVLNLWHFAILDDVFYSIFELHSYEIIWMV